MMQTSAMAKTADAPLSAEDKRYMRQIDRSLAKINETLARMEAEDKARARVRRRPRPSLLEEVKAILGK
jgi:hypothetical protein